VGAQPHNSIVINKATIQPADSNDMHTRPTYPS
jgi:hypothetical protein